MYLFLVLLRQFNYHLSSDIIPCQIFKTTVFQMLRDLPVTGC